MKIAEREKVKQRVVGTVGRLDRLQARGEVEKLIRSLSRYSEKALLILSGKSDVSAQSKKIGPALIFERLWKELEIGKVIKELLIGRRFEFDVERAIFLFVLHRLFVSGSDRACDKWRRADLLRVVAGKHDVKTLIPIADRVRKRFPIGRFCIVADRGMISKDIMDQLEDPDRDLPYILGARLRKVKEIKEDVLSRAGRHKEIFPEGRKTKDLEPLKVKEVRVNDNRYVVCLNPKRARKDAADRQAIIDSLEESVRSGPKNLVGNKGYRKYLKFFENSVSVDRAKADAEKRFDGKWVLKTNTDLPSDQVALKYKELWRVGIFFAT